MGVYQNVFNLHFSENNQGKIMDQAKLSQIGRTSRISNRERNVCSRLIQSVHKTFVLEGTINFYKRSFEIYFSL